MFPLFESIRLQNGQWKNLEYHQERMNRAIRELFNRLNTIDLKTHLHAKPWPRQGLYKVRIIYGMEIQSTEILPYTIPQVKRLKVVHMPPFEYSHKYVDRGLLDTAYAMRDSCDEIMIVINGSITDAWGANLVFTDGTHWVTPEHPLLAGTMRQQLLDQGRITTAPLRIEDLAAFTGVRLINAMNELEGPFVDVSRIVL
jgi:4-amino-4-deoxychorismate lyase